MSWILDGKYIVLMFLYHRTAEMIQQDALHSTNPKNLLFSSRSSLATVLLLEEEGERQFNISSFEL